MRILGIVALGAALGSCASSAATAQNCMQYPEGHFRYQCATRIHPGLLARRERCKEEGRQMGLRHGGGHQGVAGGLWEYVIACMRREGKPKATEATVERAPVPRRVASRCTLKGPLPAIAQERSVCRPECSLARVENISLE